VAVVLCVRLLGELGLERDGEEFAPPSGRRARALLAWLAVNPGFHVRSELAARFWPDVREESARGSLRAALTELRRALGPGADDWLVATRDQVALADGASVWVDARAVDELGRAGRLEEALELCRRGELLAGLDDDWVYEARDAHRVRLDRLIETLAARAQAGGDLDAAVALSRERVALDPLSEEAARALIGRLAEAGDRPAALAAYERLSGRLRVELGLAPSAPTRALVERIKSGAGPRVPAPPILIRRPRSAFAGRDRELGLLRAAWERAAAGSRELVLVAGEPGIGKTRLAVELAQAAHAVGATVLHGRCDEEPLVHYQPFVEALRPLAASSELRPLFPELGELEQPSDPRGARYRLFSALDSLLVEQAATGAALLLLDDLHWADKPTLLLLTYLARLSRPARLLLVGTYRETDLGRTAPLAAALAELRRDPGFERVLLRGLDEAESAQLIAGWVPIDSVGELHTRVHAETEGNPFFIEEVLSHLRETGVPIAELGVPESIREVIGRRLQRLSETAGRTLSLAAVVGRRFESAVLERIGELHGETLEQALDEAAAARLVREEPRAPGRYAFAHALIRQTLYEELSSARRVRLHARVAAALEELDAADVGTIAHHLYEAAPAGQAQQAIAYARRAAARATAQLAYEDAAEHCARALELLEPDADPQGSDRCELLLALGEARLRTGEAEAARRAFDAAADVARLRGDGGALARAALGYCGLGVTIIDVDERAVALLDEALAAVADRDPALRARLLARLGVEHYYAPSRDRSERLSREAVALARAAGDAPALGFALTARHVALWRPDGLDERLAIAGEMIAFGRRADLPEIELQGIHWRVVDLFEAGDTVAWHGAVDEHVRLAERLRLPTYRWYGPLWSATRALLEGRFEDAARLREQARADGERAGEANAGLFASMLEHFEQVLRRRFAQMDIDFIERKARESPAAPAYRTTLVWLYAELGRLEEARGVWSGLLGDGLAGIPFDANWLSAMGELAEASALLRDAEGASAIYELLSPYAEHSLAAGRGVVTYGSAHNALGLAALTAGRPDVAVTHLEKALDRHEQMGSPPLVDLTRRRLAEARAAAGGEERSPA
jgi:DNA-binding SARP family transcriptional activator